MVSLDVSAEPDWFRNRNVLVVGLGRFGGGLGVTRWLVQQGANVTVTDHSTPDSLSESVEALRDLDVKLRLGKHDSSVLDGASLAIINPAVDKLRSEFFRSIVERGIPWTTEMNLFCTRCPAHVIGVTGTYGKSTTAAMLAHTLGAYHESEGSGATTYLGGNIGRSLLPDLDAMKAEDWVILEMSSAQLEDLPRCGFAPRIALITNLTPHHSERYSSYHDYVQAKLSIIGKAETTRQAVIGALDAQAERMMTSLIRDRRTPTVRVGRPSKPVELRIVGDHHQENAACVLAVASEIGIPESTVRNALRSFRGLPHRLEFVRNLHGVAFYNDSKSTGPTATITAVAAFERPIVAMVGGQSQECPLTQCAIALRRACRIVICFGQAGSAFARAIASNQGEGGGLEVIQESSVEAAVRTAHRRACDGDVVLFSPGAPSFDAYENFEQRGRHFTELVHALT